MKIEKLSAGEYNKKYGTNFKTQKGNKYNAKKTKLDGKIFDSQSEGDFYAELKMQEKAGLIQGFDTQVKESFYYNDIFICDYYVDFLVYHNDGTQEYIEHKGVATDAWRIKWKLLMAKYKDDNKTRCTVNWYKKQNNNWYKKFKSKK